MSEAFPTLSEIRALLAASEASVVAKLDRILSLVTPVPGPDTGTLVTEL